MINRAFQDGRRNIFTLGNTDTKLEWDLFRLLQSEDFVDSCSKCESWSKSAYYCTCKFPHTCQNVISIITLFKQE